LSIVYYPENLWGHYAENPPVCQDSDFVPLVKKTAKSSFAIAAEDRSATSVSYPFVTFELFCGKDFYHEAHEDSRSNILGK
jgi:hypothetical protein